MAVPQNAIPSLSECQCLICLEILIEPVTLPCNHTLCNQCFQSTIEKASLCCPFCRRWISSWTRYHARRNSLVNTELWQIIQKHYPEECRLRMSGQKSEEMLMLTGERHQILLQIIVMYLKGLIPYHLVSHRQVFFRCFRGMESNV
uniref:RING-type E3 ubiquitin transferase n=1 Tax=Panthera leo TaxID=9689 RepID=A0A8C8XL46_PANLE